MAYLKCKILRKFKNKLKINKHAEFWAKNVFDEWKVSHGFDTTRSIIDLSNDESYIKNCLILFDFLFC
jgi:hypothetical protein